MFARPCQLAVGITPQTHPVLGLIIRKTFRKKPSWVKSQLGSWRQAASFVVGECAEGAEKARLRLDTCIVRGDPQVSRQQIQNAIKGGLVLVNGAVAKKASHATKPGDQITYEVMQTIPTKVCPEPIPLDVVYGDDDVLVVNKPPGMVVHPSAGHWTGTLVNAVMHYLNLPAWDLQGQQTAPKSLHELQSPSPDSAIPFLAADGELESLEDLHVLEAQSTPGSDNLPIFRPGIVHRLDIGTSGLMIVALNENALRHLSKQFKERTVNRVYLSLLAGCPSPTTGTVSTNIARNPNDRKTMTWFGYHSSKGRASSSNYQVVESLGGRASFVAWKLHSGRTHQIRVHAKYMGHPVFGDTAYGKSMSSPLGRQDETEEQWESIMSAATALNRPALHAASIDFEHPVTQKRMKFTANLPSDLASCLLTLRNIDSLHL